MVENPLTFDFSKTRAICDAFDSEQRQKWGNMADFNRRAALHVASKPCVGVQSPWMPKSEGGALTGGEMNFGGR